MKQSSKNSKRLTAGKKIGGVVGIILAVGVIWCLIYHDAARAVFMNLIAFDSPVPTSDDWAGGKTYLNVPYCDISQNDTVSIYVPEDVENPPLLVIVHGGGFIADDNTNRASQKMYRYFRDHGYACASVNYRLSQEAAYPAAICDVKACIRFLKAHAAEYGYDPERVALFGESAGGYLACAAALSNDRQFMDLTYLGQEEAEEPVSASVNTLIDFYGATYFREADAMWSEMKYPEFIINLANSWIRGDKLQGYEDVHSYWLRKNASELSEEEYRDICMTGFIEDNLSKEKDLSVWISHGDCDITVPIGVSKLFYEELLTQLPEDQVFFRIVPGAGHAKNRMFTDSELAQIEEFLNKNW